MDILSLTVSMLLIPMSPRFQESRDPYSIAVVKNILHQPSKLNSGFSEKQLNRLGDKVSIAILKIFSDEELKEPENIRAILALIRHAFDAPEVISIESDKHPRVTLMLLRFLESGSADEAVRVEVSGIIQFVQERTGKK